MARKTLLTESEVRRFMKLANMGPVGDTRLQEMGYVNEMPEEEEVEDVMSLDVGDEDVDVEDEVGVEDDAGLEMDMDLPEGDEVAEDVFMDVLNVLKGLAKEEYGIEMSVEEAPGEEGVEDMGAEDEVDFSAAELDMGPEGDESLDVMSGEEEVAEPVPGNTMYQEALVNKISQRVAQRLMRENKNEKLATELTERIFKRITSN